MCLARVDFIGENADGSGDHLEEVAWMERTPTGLRVTDLMGNVAELDGEIRSIDFMESVVTVERRPDPHAGHGPLEHETVS